MNDPPTLTYKLFNQHQTFVIFGIILVFFIHRINNIPGLLHGVTVGEKFGPAGVLIALGVTPLMPLSFSIDASPKFTENVEHEFRLDMP